MKREWPVVYTGNMSETIQISEKIYLRKGNLPVRDQCNTGIILGNSGLILVDLPEQFPEEEIVEEAEQYFGRTVTHLIFTHAHGDHRKGLASLKRSNLTLVAGKAACLEICKCYPKFQTEQWMTPDSGDELTLDGIKFKFWIPENLPAHSPWDMSIDLPDENLVFTGDFIVPPFYMYTYSGNWENWIGAMRDFQIKYENRLLLMGHGEPMMSGELLPMIQTYLATLGECAAKWSPERLFQVLHAGSPEMIEETEKEIWEKIGVLSEETDKNTVLRQIRELYESQGKYSG